MKKTSIKRNILYNTFYQVLTLILPFITAPYISRVIGAAGIGTYSYTLSIQTYFSMFAALGTASYGIREIARNRDDEYERSKIFWEIELLTVITTTICLIGWMVVIGISNEYKIFFVILTMNLINTMFDISWFFAGMEQFKYTIIQNTIFKILGVVALFIFVKRPEDVTLYVLIMSLSTLLGTISMWLYLPKFIKKVKFKELKVFPHFKETLIYFIPTIATSVYTVLDKTLIGVITKEPKQNGYYEQAIKIINMASAVTFASLNTVLSSRNSYLFIEKKEDEIKKKINLSINYILFLGIGMVLGLMAVTDKFVPIFYGKGYDEVITLIKILSPLIIIIGISNCLGSQYYNPAGLRNRSAKFIIAGACTNLILNLILIPNFRARGAAVATIIAELTITMLYLKRCDGFYSFRLLLKFAWKKIIAGVGMIIIISLLNLLNIGDLGMLILQVSVGVLVYMTILFMIKDEFVVETFKQLRKKIKGGGK